MNLVGHLDTRHFVIIECRHQANGSVLKCGCIGLMLFHNLSCLDTIICYINTIGIVPAYACNVCDAFVASCATHIGIRHRVLTNQRDRSYVYAVVSLAAGGPFVGGPIVTYIFSRVSVGSACVRVWKRDCDVTSLVEPQTKNTDG